MKRDWFAIIVLVVEIAILLIAAGGIRSSRDAYQYLPAIVLTGQNPLPDETLNEFDILGAHVRYKPIRASDLIETVRELFTRR